MTGRHAKLSHAPLQTRSFFCLLPSYLPFALLTHPFFLPYYFLLLDSDLRWRCAESVPVMMLYIARDNSTT